MVRCALCGEGKGHVGEHAIYDHVVEIASAGRRLCVCCSGAVQAAVQSIRLEVMKGK